MMRPPDDLDVTRRHFLSRLSMGVGAMALGSLASAGRSISPGQIDHLPHFAPRARRVIYLFQSGGPSQLDLFDYKPLLEKRNGEELPESVRKGQRLTGMSGNQSSLPLAGAQFGWKRHGESGAWVSELLPHTARIVDKLCFVRSMHTEAINHDPAITFFQTGSQIAGRPSMGSWISYGLGSENRNLPAYIVLVTKDKGGQPLYSRLWGSGFIDSRHQGVQLRAGRDPVLYLTNPEGVSPERRRRMLDRLRSLDAEQFLREKDPEIDARIAQYEMAYRMQMSVPELTDFTDEKKSTLELYGPDVHTPGTFTANCLLARRLAERGVRFIQLYMRGWDQHGNLPSEIRAQCQTVDQAQAALIKDLKQRGMLDDTLVMWAGEFGRTVYSQGALTRSNYGRDHHPRCFSIWLAGGGVKPGISYGRTDDFSYNIVENPVEVHDLHATLLHLLGVNHRDLIHRHQGRDFRLTDVHGKIIEPILA
jgi:hypothetical protein